MRRFLFIVVIAALIALGIHFLRPRLFPVKEETPPPPEPVVRLSRFIDSQIAPIFAPLSTKEKSIDTHELRKLREGFKDSLAQRDGDPKELQLAIRLCDTLQSAVDAREAHLKRLKSAETASYASLGTNSEDSKSQKREFFVQGISSSWTTESKKFRDAVDRDYAALRSIER